MLNRKIDFTFWGVTLFQRALKCITLNKMKKSIVHYGDNVVGVCNKKLGFNFGMYIRKVPYRGLGVKLPPSPM